MTMPDRIWADAPEVLDDCGIWNATPRDGATEYVPADLAGNRVTVKPLDLSNLLKHAFIAGRVSGGAASSFHGHAWTEYDPTESAAYARILSAINVQPDPRDAVIARLVEALVAIRGYDQGYSTELRAIAHNAIEAAKAVQS